MTDLVERYIHQVGRYLPQKERADIQVELRSQISDQLEDRYGDQPTAEDVRATLIELGDPRRLAASYGKEQYLVGPELYPVMMGVLRSGWLLVPVVVTLVNVIVALFPPDGPSIPQLLINTTLAVVQTLLTFTAVVVAIFAVLQHAGEDEDIDRLTGRNKSFDPDKLPAIDPAGKVERFDAGFDIAFYVFVIIALLYFLRVGGLTLRFSLSDPGEVIAAPALWLVLTILAVVAQLGLTLLAMGNGRWTVGTHLLQMAAEALGAVFAYFAIVIPLFGYLLNLVPSLGTIPYFEWVPLAVLVSSLANTLVSGGIKLFRMMTVQRPPAVPAK